MKEDDCCMSMSTVTSNIAVSKLGFRSPKRRKRRTNHSHIPIALNSDQHTKYEISLLHFHSYFLFIVGIDSTSPIILWNSRCG